MLRYNQCIADVAGTLRSTDFYAAVHQLVYDGIVGLWNKGKPADLVTVTDALAGKVGKNKESGVTYAELGELWDAAPTAANVEQYAKIVKDRSLERGLLLAANEITRVVGTVSATEAVERAEKEILGIADLGADGKVTHISEVIGKVRDAIDRRVNGEVDPGVPVDWPDLNSLIGDFRGGEMCVVAARISVGKTSFGLDIARRAAEKGNTVLIVSLEQSQEEIGERLLSLTSGVPCQRIRDPGITGLSTAEMEKIEAASTLVRRPAVFIDDQCGQSMLRIAANARRIKHRHGLDLVLIDYIQLIEPENRRDNREQQVAQIARRIKWLARELNVPIIALAQLNRASETENRQPRLSDLRESDGVGQDADKVILLWRASQDGKAADNAECQPVEVIVAKHRNGRTGLCGLNFRKDCMRFENAAKEQPRSPFEEREKAP